MRRRPARRQSKGAFKKRASKTAALNLYMPRRGGIRL